MRILASNPDTLGDLILRQPLYAALREGGHELMLIVRPAVRAVLPYVAPGVEVIELPYEVYADDLASKWSLFNPTFQAARDWRPDLLLVAPYRWTLFEERLAAELPGVRRAGMSGTLYAGNPYVGQAPQSSLTFDVTATVDIEAREVEKNAALAAAVLGSPISESRPVISADHAARVRAEEILSKLDLSPGGYWVACVSGTIHVPIKAWPPEHWGRVLAEWAQRFDRRFLFVGLHDELPAVRAVQAAMGSHASHTTAWMEPGGRLEELIGLTALSSGYIGHDTGPMHVAAALKKPTLAVFGGGHGLRFAPAVEPSVALVVGVPCWGCGWSCSFSTSHCVKQVPPDDVFRAATDLEEGRVAGAEARVIEPGEGLLRQMVTEAAVFAQEQVREAGQRGRYLEESHRYRQEEVAAVRAEVARALAEVERAQGEADEMRAAREASEHAAATRAAEAAAREAELREAREQLDRTTQELSQTRAIAAASVTAAEVKTKELSEQKKSLSRLAADIGGFLESGARLQPAPAAGPETEPGPQSKELVSLRQQVDRLKRRVHETPASSPPPRPPRRPLRQVMAELIVGRRDYPAPPSPPLPRITVVTPVLKDTPGLRQTIESVLGQGYVDLEYIVVDGGSTDEPAALLHAYRGRVSEILQEPSEGPMHAAGAGFARARGDVLHLLLPGDVLEPGGALRVAQFFSRHPGVQAAYFDDSITAPTGWRFLPSRGPTLDVYALLAKADPIAPGLFVRRGAYERIGKFDPAFPHAGDWHLWARLDRRWEVRRVAGQVRSVSAGGLASRAGIDYVNDLERARASFLASFGTPGRLRCGMLHAINQLWDAVTPRLRRDRFDFRFSVDDKETKTALPPVEPPDFVPGQPVSPLTSRPPDRLLFSTPDTTGGDRQLSYVYLDTAAGAAVAYPPIGPERLNALYEARAHDPQRSIAPPASGASSPFAGYSGSVLWRLLMRLPSPYWWFRQPRFDSTVVDDLLAALANQVSTQNADLRLLNVGCFQGQVLEQLKAATRWKLAGTETNEQAAAMAREKGFKVWNTAPQDAAMVAPVGEVFDVIFLDGVIERLQDPLLVIRRLRQLLSPRGLIVVYMPNLDSAHVRLFGPTWRHWQLPYHRTLMGRRAIKRLAFLADMRLLRFRTVTHPYPATVSAQLNEVGLGGIVPDGARFPDVISSRGVRLTGWTRLLCDWRGKGDNAYAVLRIL